MRRGEYSKAREPGCGAQRLEHLPKILAPCIKERLFVKQSRELVIGESCLPNDASDDGFWQIKALMARNGYPPGPLGVLQLHVRARLFVDIKASLLQGAENLSWLEAAESGD